jgi:hypothetical protein
LVAKLIADISIGKQQSLKPIKAKRIAV